MADHLDSYTPGTRSLTADDLHIGVRARASATHGSTAPDSPQVDSSDPFVQKVTRLATSYGGVLFTGPPGTSKSFRAAQIAELLAEGDRDRIWFVQFHASYQYEDFMCGYAPDEGGGFQLRPGPFLQACLQAGQDPDRRRHVLVIDELSRADVGRVFGEALTYVERSKRELKFDIASGQRITVPSNLVVLATMNPQDRGVDEVDAAFERRFAKVAMNPDPGELETILETSQVDPELRNRIGSWFRRINGLARSNPAAAVGHAYFANVTDQTTLTELWEHQLQFLVERAFRLDEQTRTEIESAWHRIGQAQHSQPNPVAPQPEAEPGADQAQQ